MWYLQREPGPRNRRWLFTVSGCDPLMMIVWVSIAIVVLLPLLQLIRQGVMPGP